MNSTEEIEDIELEMHPATGGWAIVAVAGGEHFFIEGGLITPEPRLEYWSENIGLVASAISKAKAVL